LLLSDLDGFLTGVICSPELIAPSDWLSTALGGPPTNVPPEILDLIMQRYNEIVAAMNSIPPLLEPVFWQAKEGHVIAMDWCEGFMDAVALRKSEWDSFMATKQGKQWMQPIIDHLFDEDFVSVSGVGERELYAHLDRAAKKIPETVPKIVSYWQSKRGMQALH
jgi:yecA family protein